jgi:hypothetical protein
LNIFHLGLEARIIIQDINQTKQLKSTSKCSQASQSVVEGSVDELKFVFDDEYNNLVEASRTVKIHKY